MGQAAVDLPDPSEVPPAPVHLSADDLLSQMAGDEIDRLLAEAEGEKGSGAPERDGLDLDVTSAADAPLSDLPGDAQLDNLLQQISDQPEVETTAVAAAILGESNAKPAVAAPAVENPNESADLARQLDNMLAAVDAPPSPEPADAAVETVAVSEPTQAQSTAGAVAESPAGEIASEDRETSSAEKSALAEVVDAMEVAPPADDELDEPRIPVYLKPLVWVNAPMMLLPEPIRDAIGKIAILTAFNAIAVLIYVLLFRKSH